WDAPSGAHGVEGGAGDLHGAGAVGHLDAGGAADGDRAGELGDLGGVGVLHGGDVGQEAVTARLPGRGDVVEGDGGVAGAVVPEAAAIAGEVEGVAETGALGSPEAAAVAERAGAVGEDHVGGAHGRVGGGDLLAGVDRFRVAGEPERLVDVVDHLVHHDAAGALLVGGPVPVRQRAGALEAPPE